jgi:hypothetical protein
VDLRGDHHSSALARVRHSPTQGARMSLRSVLASGGIALFLLAIASAQPAEAQLKWRIHGGMIQPMAVGDDYFAAGPSISFDVAKPLTSTVDLQLDAGWDYLNTDDTHPTPVTNLWRYRAELEARLLGDGQSGLAVSAFGGAGATTMHSHKFWLVSQQQRHIEEDGVPYTFDGERLHGTMLTATGGLRVGAHSADGIMWWLTGKLNWNPLSDFNQDALRELSTNRFEPNGLDPISSVMGFTLQLGVGL